MPELTRVPRAVAIGNFDGVHRGHRAVLQRAVTSGLRPTVITFDPHPRTFFGGQVPALCGLDRRFELLTRAGIEDVLVVGFDATVAACEAEDWVRELLRPIGTELVCVGEGFRFGRGRAGDVALLERMGLKVAAVPLVDDVCSTRVRELVRAGDVGGAARCLGRSLEIQVVAETVTAAPVTGVRASVRPARPGMALPPPGDYAVRVVGRDGLLQVTADAPWSAVLHTEIVPRRVSFAVGLVEELMTEAAA